MLLLIFINVEEWIIHILWNSGSNTLNKDLNNLDSYKLELCKSTRENIHCRSFEIEGFMVASHDEDEPKVSCEVFTSLDSKKWIIAMDDKMKSIRKKWSFEFG